MRSRRFAAMVALAVAGIDIALLWPGAASASAPTAVGGWRIERQTTPAGAVPTSPLTDDGTLAVRNGPGGVLAFSAVRYEGDGGVLLLDLAGQPPPTVPAVEACRITGTWTTGADQTWDSRPTYDCAHHVVAMVSGSQLSWQLDSGFVNGGALDVALVPDPADTTPYAVSFALPTAASFQPNDAATTFVPPPPPPAAVPPASTGAPTVSGVVPVAPAVDAPAAATPLVAPASPAAVPQIAAAPAAATREPGSRAAGAGALAAFAFILLVRSFVTGGSRGHVPRSLLLINREGA